MATIAYADVVHSTPLPVDAQDVLTKVHIVIAGTKSGRAPDYVWTAHQGTGITRELLTYAPWPVAYTHTDAAHATYGVEGAREFKGANPFHAAEATAVGEPAGGTGLTNAGSPSAIRDGDATTYGAPTDGSGVVAGTAIWHGYVPIVGYRIRYELGGGANDLAYVAMAYTDEAANIVTRAAWVLPPSSDGADVYAVLPLDARMASVNGGSQDDPLGVDVLRDLTFYARGDAKLYEAYPLIPDTVGLAATGASLIRTPAASPRRLVVRGYVAPDGSLTVTGYPGGDLVATVAQVTYDQGYTILDLGQAGAPAGANADIVEAFRGVSAQRSREIGRAAYDLLMGERQ